MTAIEGVLYSRLITYMDTFFYAQGEWAYNYPPEEGRYLKLNDTEGGFEDFS